MEIKDLLRLQKQIEEGKTEKAQLEGERNAIMKQLEKDWGCKTVQQAEKKIKEMEKEIEQLDADIEVGLEELEQKYEL